MTKQFSLLGQLSFFFLVMMLISLIHASVARKEENVLRDSDDDESADEQRRAYEMKKLRHFLLTANADERAAKRELVRLEANDCQGESHFIRSALIQVKEYLRSIDDPDSSRLEEVKSKR